MHEAFSRDLDKVWYLCSVVFEGIIFLHRHPFDGVEQPGPNRGYQLAAQTAQACARYKMGEENKTTLHMLLQLVMVEVGNHGGNNWS